MNYEHVMQNAHCRKVMERADLLGFTSLEDLFHGRSSYFAVPGGPSRSELPFQPDFDFKFIEVSCPYTGETAQFATQSAASYWLRLSKNHAEWQARRNGMDLLEFREMLTAEDTETV